MGGGVVPTDYFRVEGGNRLGGEFLVQGAKNAALKQMAATILATGEHHLYNVPRIDDVDIMAEVLASMGIVSEWAGEDHLVVITPTAASIKPLADYELVEKIRASITVLGPLIARLGTATISMPGGDDFGHRPIDMHLAAIAELGASFSTSHGYVEGTTTGLKGANVALEFPSHTGTDNVLMAAVLAKGTTVISNCAREPEVADLALMLNSMGARISGMGTSTLTVEGVSELHPANHSIIPDRIDAATALGAVGMNQGRVLLRGARTEHMEMLIRKLGEIGLSVTKDAAGLIAESHSRLDAVSISSLPYPGIATDYLPILVAMLSTADGDAIVTENIFAGRFKYVDELRRLGATMTTHGHHVAIRGVSRLQGAPIKATDIRAGAALVVAALAAEGESRVFGTSHIDRGYVDLPRRLLALGGKVERCSEER